MNDSLGLLPTVDILSDSGGCSKCWKCQISLICILRHARAYSLHFSRIKSMIRYDNLDGMMASLDTDLAKKGVRVNNRGMCSACDKVIVGKVMNL